MRNPYAFYDSPTRLPTKQVLRKVVIFGEIIGRHHYFPGCFQRLRSAQRIMVCCPGTSVTCHASSICPRPMQNRRCSATRSGTTPAAQDQAKTTEDDQGEGGGLGDGGGSRILIGVTTGKIPCKSPFPGEVSFYQRTIRSRWHAGKIDKLSHITIHSRMTVHASRTQNKIAIYRRIDVRSRTHARYFRTISKDA